MLHIRTNQTVSPTVSLFLHCQCKYLSSQRNFHEQYISNREQKMRTRCNQRCAMHWTIYFRKNQDIWNNRQDLLTMNPLKERCDLFTCLNPIWKYPLWIQYNCLLWVSVKLAHTEAFPIDLLTYWSLIFNLFSSSMYVITCIERSHKGACWWEVNIGSGNGLAPSDNKLLPGPGIVKQAHDAIGCRNASNF